MTNEKVFKMPFSRVYPLLVEKAKRKGRTKAEVDTVICWLTGYNQVSLESQVTNNISYEQFFAEAPLIHPRAKLITGTLCGQRVEEIADPLMQKIRYLDKLVDELAKGKVLEKVIRQ